MTKVPKKKPKLKKEDSKTKNTASKKDSKQSKTTSQVQLDSLQSIFATKALQEETFTLFGGEAPAVEIDTPTIPAERPSVKLVERPAQGAVYFFPHFDDPEKNLRSLFPVSEEPFFHHRTEYVTFDFCSDC